MQHSRPLLPLMAVLLAVGAWRADAMEPPQPGELAGYALDGTLADRVAYAKEEGNHRVDPELVARATSNLDRMVREAQGLDPEIAAAPPPAYRGVPSTGNVKMLCLLIEFNDLRHDPANTREAIDSALFGAGEPAFFPCESLTKYYQRSSYNKLNIQGNTLGWYRTAYDRSAVGQNKEGRQALIKEAIRYYAAQGHDFSQYDNDGDGDVDVFHVIYAGDPGGWGSFWWGWQCNWQDWWPFDFVEVNGKRLSKYTFQFQSQNTAGGFDPTVVIHETGHALGLPDYYDYDRSDPSPDVGPSGGVGGLDMMGGSKGDHNCFSKWILGWLTPTMVAGGSQTIQLRPSDTTGDCVMIIPGASPAGQFSEYFMVQNRTKAGNDSAWTWPGSGMMIWHVDATLATFGNDYAYNNSYTSHKLLRLMEADGLEQIESGEAGDAGDFYVAGRAFTPTSDPNSAQYNGQPSWVSVTNFTPAQSTMSALFTLVNPVGVPPVVWVTSPVEGASSPQGATVAIAASATDQTFGIPASVAFYVDGALVSTATTMPYTASWIGTATGSHVLTAVATGFSGMTTTSPPVSINVTAPNPPANDFFAGRITIAGNANTVTGTNVNSSAQTSEPAHHSQAPQKSVWWTWTPSITGTATITTAGSNYDTILAAYTGSAIGSLVARASNDDAEGGVRTSSVVFAVTAGVPIQIAVDGYNGAAGTITLNVSVVYVPPANDHFANATVISNGSTPVTVTGTNNGATAQTGEPAHAGSGPDASVWWKWTAPSTGTLWLSTSGSSFDTVLAVYTGTAVNALTLQAANDDVGGGNRTSEVSVAVTGGTIYLIAVDGYHGAAGNVSVRASFDDFNDPPTLSLNSPWNGQSVGLNSTLHVAAEAFDPEGRVKEVRFYVNGALVATRLPNPGSVSFETDQPMTTAGYRTVTATAEDQLGLTASASVTVLVSAITLPEALNNFSLVWASGGTQSWSGTAAKSHDGTSSAVSGTIGDLQQSWFSTAVTGPGNIACWWSVSSENTYDYLRFYIDGVKQANEISGEVGWTQASWTIPAGNHTLKWQYEKDGSRAAGSDAAWVDQVVWLTPPVLAGISAVTAPTGVPLTYTLSSDVSVASYSVLSGALPNGLTLNPTTGAVTGSPLTAGTFNVTFQGTNAAGSGTKALTFTIFAALPIPISVDMPPLVWTTGGDSLWYGQSTTTHDGVDAAQSGDIADSQSVWAQTSVAGPGTLTFWWKVSSEAGYDYLRFFMDGVEQGTAPKISGAVDWQQVTVTIPVGNHTLRWTYAKDTSLSSGADAAWLDQVVFAPPLPLALDTPMLTWATSGNANWAGQILTTHDGVDAAQSGPIAHAQQSTTEISIAGAGSLTFWWKVSSEPGYDNLRFYLDGVEQAGITGISGEVDWQQKTLTVPVGTHTLRWTYSKDINGSVGADCAWLDQVVFAPSLPQALDTPALAWATSGNAAWAGQMLVTHDGVDAAQSGPITHEQLCTIETTVTGPGLLTFWWKVSSEANYDYLAFLMDGVEQTGIVGISGEVDWQQKSLLVPAGTHTLSWIYAKDYSRSAGSDAAWLDQVVFAPDLSQAVDSPTLLWASSGHATWAGQMLITHDGVDAAQSGLITHDQQSITEILVAGAGTLTFWWKVSSEAGYDVLRFFMDGVEQPGIPGISGEVDWQQKTFAVPVGTHYLTWIYSKDGSQSAGADAGWLDQVVFAPSLSQALDTPMLAWATSGNANWAGQVQTTHDGVDAAQSGLITHSQQTTTEISVAGAGALSFWWKVSSETNFDFLRFYLDGVEQAGITGISGEVDWQQKTLAVPAGTHTLRWTYSKDGSNNAGADAAWLDQVVFAPVLPQALDTPNLVWTTRGNAPWAGQMLTTHDGVDAAQSGAIGDGQESTTEVVVNGAGTLSFWWKISSPEGSPNLRFFMDGIEQSGIGAIFGTVDWQQRTLAVPVGPHTLRWTYSRGTLGGNTGPDTAWLDQVVFTPDLPQALDTPALTWTTAGDANWAGQMFTTHDGVDAAQSGPITHSQLSATDITVTGPGTLSFWWKVSSEPTFDRLRFSLDNAEQAGISGEVDWQQKSLAIPAGTHTLRWIYSKDDSQSVGADAAWLDQVVFTSFNFTAPGTTAGRSLWTRPEQGAPPTEFPRKRTTVPYDAMRFTVSTTGEYTLTSTAEWNNYLFLYSNAFDPARQLSNVLLGNDDFGPIGVAGFTTTLTAGTPYFLVTTGYTNSNFGFYSLNISGVGSVEVTQTVPGTTTGRPTWRRPDHNGTNPPLVLSTTGTAVPFDVVSFTVSASGNYSMKSTGAWDTYLFLYADRLSPGYALPGVVIGNDDFGAVGVAGFNNVTLYAGITYFLVTTGYQNYHAGKYTLEITGPGRPQAESALANWRLTWFGNKINSGDGADSNDYDHDGVSNLLEFAFGLAPTRNSSRLLPQWQKSGANYSVTFTQPDGVTGITYGAEWSSSLLPGSWAAISDTGVAPQHTFSLGAGADPKLFLRLKVTVP
jgi:M6 family metalloprotease-like protein